MTADWGLDQGALPAALVGDAPQPPVTLSELEFDVLWGHLALPEMPLVLKVASPGKTYTERRELARGAWRALAERGLAEAGSPVPRLAELLGLLASPDREFDGRLWFGRRTGSVRLLVASTGPAAVLATRTSTGLSLREAATSGLAREALGVLPTLAAGPGESVTLPSATLTAAAEQVTTPVEFAAALRANGVRERDADALAAMLMRIRRHGQFGAAARDKWGHRVRAPRVLSVFDTRTGRYLQLRRANGEAEPWTTVSPADPRLLLRELEGLLEHH